GSNALGPNAVSESSSAKTANAAPANEETSATGASPNGDGTSMPEGTSTTAESQSTAAIRLTELATPPSMECRPAIISGGQAPGTAQLAATASTSSTCDRRSKTTNSPVSISIAVRRNTRSGHSCDGRRCAIT